MADNYHLLAQTQLPNSVASVWTNSFGNDVIVKKIVLTNPTGASATAKLHHVESAESPVDENVILSEVTLDAGDTAHDADPFVVEAGESIYGVSDTASAISFSIYGLEIVP